jgi:hypothetical protein
MPQTRRAQFLMEPAEYRLLEDVARRQGTSVAELFRSAVRRVYLATPSERMSVVERFSEMSISLPDWEVLEAELEEAHDGGIH